MGRPRRALLSQEIIADAALSLIDETGELSMTALSSRLGVAASSLYNHVEGRTEVIEILRSRLVNDDLSTPPDGGWAEAITWMLTSLRATWAQHPRVLPLLFDQPIVDVKALRMYDHIAHTLFHAGLDEAETAAVIGVVDAFALGIAVDLSTPDVVWTPTPESHVPHLRRILAVGVPDRADHAFTLGLDVLVDGIRAKIERSSASRAAREPIRTRSITEIT